MDEAAVKALIASELAAMGIEKIGTDLVITAKDIKFSDPSVQIETLGAVKVIINGAAKVEGEQDFQAKFKQDIKTQSKEGSILLRAASDFKAKSDGGNVRLDAYNNIAEVAKEGSYVQKCKKNFVRSAGVNITDIAELGCANRKAKTFIYDAAITGIRHDSKEMEPEIVNFSDFIQTVIKEKTLVELIGVINEEMNLTEEELHVVYEELKSLVLGNELVGELGWAYP